MSGLPKSVPRENLEHRKGTEITRCGLQERLDCHRGGDTETVTLIMTLIAITVIIANTYCTYVPGTVLMVF